MQPFMHNIAQASTTPYTQDTHKNQHLGMASGGVISVGALTYGFGDCAFDADKAESCVAHAAGLLDKFQAVGDHLIQWAMAIFRAVF